MTDKKNIINPDEDFELDGLSNFVEGLNKNEESEKDSFNESLLDSNNNEELPSFLNESDEFNLDDLTSDGELNLDDIDFENNEEVDFTGDSTPDIDFEDNSESSSPELEQNIFLSEDDDISTDEFNALSQNTDLDFSSDSDKDDSLNDLNMEGITEIDSNENEDLNLSNNDDDDFNLDSFEDTSLEDNNSWNNNDSVDDLLNKDDDSSFLNDDFNQVEPVSDDEFNLNDDQDVTLDNNNFETTSFDDLDDNSNNFDSSSDFDNNDFSNDLKDEWDNGEISDTDFDTSDLNKDEEGATVMPLPIPVPVKEGFFSKFKNKFQKKKDDDNEPVNSNLENGINASKNDVDDFEDDDISNGSPLNATKDLNNNTLADDIEEEQKRKANKANILKLSVLAVVIAAAVGGFYAYKNNMLGGMDSLDDSSDAYVEHSEPVKTTKPVVSKAQTNNANDLSSLNSSNLNTGNNTSGLSQNQVADLKKDILAQVSTDRIAMEQRISSLEKENAVLKKIINEVQTSIDPDTINRFKVEFNDLTSKTKQLQVQFDDDQSANKLMATNFYSVVRKLNDDVQRIDQTAATQNSLDEQTKRIDNSFKQLVKMKDKDAEDNLLYRVDLIEKRMKFRNPNNDRSFEDKNNVKKVLSEGLFEGDTVKQEQQIPDIKYKYSFVGMIEGVIYLKTNSGDIKDFKVGDTLPGYGEVLKINENGSLETEKQGTVSFK